MRNLIAIFVLCMVALCPAYAQQEVELYRFTWDVTGDTDNWGVDHMLGGVVSGLMLQADYTDASWEEDPDDIALPEGPERYVNLNGIDLSTTPWPYDNVFPESGGSLNLLKDSLVYEGWVGPRLSTFSPSAWWNRQTLKQWLVENKGVSPDAIITAIEFNVTAGSRPIASQGLMSVDFWFGGYDSGAITGSRIRKTNLDAWGHVSYNPIKWTRTTYRAADIRTGDLITGSSSIRANLGDLNGLVGITFSNVQPGEYGKFIDDVRIFGVIQPTSSTVADARNAHSGGVVSLSDVVVSQKFENVPGLPPCCIYVQDSVPASSGIRVEMAPDALFASLQPGDHVNIEGTVAIIGGERQIQPSSLTVLPVQPDEPSVYAMTGRDVVAKAGLGTTGLRTRVFGRVVKADPVSKYILIDDGSGILQALGTPPIKNGGMDDGAPSGPWTMPTDWKKVPESSSGAGDGWNQAAWWYVNAPADPTNGNNAVWETLPRSGRGWMGVGHWDPQNDALYGGYQQVTGYCIPGRTYAIEAYGIAYHNGTGNAKVRLGVDPAGGTNYTAPTVVWSDYVVSSNPRDWRRMETTFTATGPTITIYLEMNQLEAVKSTTVEWPLTVTCFDDVRVLMQPDNGLKVCCDFGSDWPEPGTYVTVTGISGIEVFGPDPNPVIWAVPEDVVL